MVDLIDAPHGFIEFGAIQDRPFDQGMLETSQVATMAGAEVVEDDDLGLALEMFDDVRTDEAGTAGDEDFHGLFDERLHRRQLGFDGLDQLELGAQTVEVVLWTLDFEIHVTFQPVREEA